MTVNVGQAAGPDKGVVKKKLRAEENRSELG
jgi:hypothetical protein